MITRERISVSRAQDPAGTMCPYLNVAAYDFHKGTDTPDREDSHAEKRWPIIAEYKPNAPSTVWYWGNAFRASNGNAWGTPIRWAYYRGEEEVWNPDRQQWEIPGLTYTAPPATAPTGKAGVHMDACAGLNGDWD